jgi:hypothetical protein
MPDPDKVRESKRKWREANRERANAASLLWYYNNRERCCARKREWAAKNPDKVRENGRRNDAKPHRKLPRGDALGRVRRYQQRNLEKVRAGRRAYQAKRRADPVQRTIDAIRRRMRRVIKGKTKGAFVLLGYTAEQLRDHLALQFQPGMTWSNYGLYGDKWHVDHKCPVSSFKLPDELVECFALENLQPLWAADNLRKHARSLE